MLSMPLGKTSFREIRSDGSWYCDKTRFFGQFLQSAPKVTFITRPRRFGKTLFMNTLAEFFDITKKSTDIFAGLDVTKDKELCAKWMNQYPVLFLSLKDAEASKYDSAVTKMRSLLYGWCTTHEALLDSLNVTNGDKKYFQKLLEKEVSSDEMQDALKTLIRIMSSCYGKPVIVLIDEYDVPIAKAEQNGYYTDMLEFIRGFLSSGLKDNPDLQFAVLTGCLRISGESIFTGFNLFKCYSVSQQVYSDIIGFTNDEVKALLTDVGLTQKESLIRAWYDGYRFGKKSEIYCPWDVLQYVSDLQVDHKAEPQCYWKNSSSNDIIFNFIQKYKGTKAITDAMEILRDGGILQTALNEELTYQNLYGNAKNVWSVLYQTGYLTNIDPNVAKETGIAPCEGESLLVIPNKEVRQIYEESFASFAESIEQANRSDLFAALWSGDCTALTRVLNAVLLQTISYRDAHEDYYHAFTAGLFTMSGYDVRSNKEAGNGLPDLQVIDTENARAAILEFKYYKQKKNRKRPESDKQIQDKLAALAVQARKQIDDKKYVTTLIGASRKVFCYGVSFYKKQCFITNDILSPCL